jgi:hypothetical protein
MKNTLPASYVCKNSNKRKIFPSHQYIDEKRRSCAKMLTRKRHSNTETLMRKIDYSAKMSVKGKYKSSPIKEMKKIKGKKINRKKGKEEERT